MKRVLITGSAGFVGRAFVRHFVRNVSRCTVVGIDPEVVEQRRAKVWRSEILDCRNFFAADDGYYDLVIHCAAIVGGRAMIDGEPLRLMAEDLSIDAALFGWALRARPGRIVYFSSSAAYSTNLQSRAVTHRTGGYKLDERFGYEGPPDATYGLVKRVGERLAAEANAAGIPTHVLRPFSGYGTDQALDYPFPKFIRRALDRDDPFEIWGAGDSARDWVHISDVVGAVLAAIDQDVLGPVNICTGRATTFDELAKMVMDAAGYEAPIKYVDGPQGVHWRVGDPTKMLEFYTPRVSLEDGIARAIRGWQ